jgi:hypothetical protein
MDKINEHYRTLRAFSMSKDLAIYSNPPPSPRPAGGGLKEILGYQPATKLLADTPSPYFKKALPLVIADTLRSPSTLNHLT